MKRLLFSVSIAPVLWVAACSGGNGVVNPPPPVGKYSLASLKGQYAFVTNGEVFAGSVVDQLARVGSFTADGAGNIMGGVEDVNEATVGVTPAIAITGGSYTVNADGRGTLTLQLAQASIDFGITLTSINDGLLVDETSNANQSSTGSGNFVKQNASSFQVSGIAGPYVFDFPGLDANSNPESFVGEFTANNGTISAGFFDDNVNGTFSSGAFVGTVAQDPLQSASLTSFGRGIALIAGQNYVFYIVDATRVRFISTNGGMLSGDAVAQSNTIPTNVSSINSSFVFIVAGSSGSGGIVRVGRFTANGATVTNVLEDTNDNGKFIKTDTTAAASISLDAANPGRGTFTFTDPNFPNAPSTFVFYLSSATQGVIQEQTANKNGAVDVADGTLAAQTGSPFSGSNISGTYALSWSGLSLQNGGGFSVQDEEDLLGQVTVSSLNLTGAADIFQFQNVVPVFDLVTSGSVNIQGDGTSSTGSSSRNTMSVKLVKSNTTTVNFVVYFVSPQLAFFMNNQDQNRTVAGALQIQQ
ncbi:MAG TPA: hypothetical protein VJO16_13875 [Candidatus Acidoferrum sp.]|nr:hypothetical protein [Candidatus Acidoferrum sp.]